MKPPEGVDSLEIRRVVGPEIIPHEVWIASELSYLLDIVL